MNHPLPPPSRGWLFAAVWIALAAAHVAPLLEVRYLPLCDLPEHLAQAAIRLRYQDPLMGFSEHYEVLGGLRPYDLHPALCQLALRVLDVRWAARALSALAVLAVPLALLRLVRSSGRDPWFALLGFPLSYSGAFFWGFHAWLLGVSLLLFSLESLIRPPGRPAVRRLVWLGWSALILLAHPLSWALFVLAALVVAGLGARRDLPQRLLPLLPSSILFALWARESFFGGSPIYGNWWREGIGAWYGDGGALPARALASLTNVYVGPWDEAVLFGGTLLLVFTRLRGGTGERNRATRPGGRGLPALALLCLLLWAFLPTGVRGFFAINDRFLLPAALLAIATVPRLHRAAARPVRTGLVVVAASSAAVHLAGFRALGQENPGLESVAAAVPVGARVVDLILEPRSAHLLHPHPYAHYGAYVQAERGGLRVDTFRTIGIAYRPGTPGDRAPPASRLAPERHDPLRDFPGFEWFLLLDPERRSPLHRNPQRVECRAAEGAWSLYRRRPP